MIIRQVTESAETSLLCEHACHSLSSRGRRVPESSCPVRTAFQVDRDSILHSASRVLRELFEYFKAKPGELLVYGGRCNDDEKVEIAIADFLAGMTDRYAMNLYQKLFFPQPCKAV